MTNNLKCPFCGAELDDAVEHLVCPNTDCKFGCNPMTTFVWQVLIDGKKAQDALKIVDGKLKVIANDENPSPIQSQALDCYIQIAKDCRDTITSITKGKDK